MGIFPLFVVASASSCSVLLLGVPWVHRTSPEAERMFALVRSNREDTRRIGPVERLRDAIAGQIGRMRTRMGANKNCAMLKRFAEAGLRAPQVADLFFLAQAAGLLGGAVGGSFVAANPVFWTLAGGAVGFMVPDAWLASRQKSRRDRLRRSLPDMIDLLVICVGAGLGLDQALLRVSEELRLSHPDITEELERVALERRAGAARIDAWGALAERTRIEELASFVSMLAETDRFGSPIIKALSDFSEEIRTKRRQKAEEAAAKTKIKIIFPLVLFIFPCIFIVLLAPAILSFAQSFGAVGK